MLKPCRLQNYRDHPDRVVLAGAALGQPDDVEMRSDIVGPGQQPPGRGADDHQRRRRAPVSAAAGSRCR